MLESSVQPYDVVQALAHAPTSLTFGQLLRDDAVHARNQLRRVFIKPCGPKAPIAAIETKIAPQKPELPISIYGYQ